MPERSATSAFDAFLKLDGIKGESMTKGHAGEIDILSFSFGASNAHSSSSGGGGGTGKAVFHDLSVTKFADLSSTALFLAVATGQHIKEGTLTVRKSGGEAHKYMVIKLTDVLVSSFQSAATEGHNATTPLEQLSLGYSKIEFSYTEQDKAGKAGKSVSHGFDVKANTKV